HRTTSMCKIQGGGLADATEVGGCHWDQANDASGELHAQVWPSGEGWCTISCNGNRRPYNAWVGSITSTLAVKTTVLPLWAVCCSRFDVLGVDQQDVESPLQQVPNRLPVHPRRLHGHRRAPRSGQPIGEGQDPSGHGGEAAYLSLPPPLWASRSPDTPP